jgi:hypothetical protein
VNKETSDVAIKGAVLLSPIGPYINNQGRRVYARMYLSLSTGLIVGRPEPLDQFHFAELAASTRYSRSPYRSASRRKLPTPPPPKVCVGSTSLPLLLTALGCRLVLCEDDSPAALALLQRLHKRLRPPPGLDWHYRSAASAPAPANPLRTAASVVLNRARSEKLAPGTDLRRSRWHGDAGTIHLLRFRSASLNAALERQARAS